MITNYITILMRHFEQMNIEVAAAAETELETSSVRDRDDTYDCNRFLFVKEGSGKIIVQGKEIPMKQGTLIILLSGIPHRIELNPDEKLTLQWCHFRSSYEDRDLYRTLQIPFFIQLNNIQEASALFVRLREELARDGLTSRLKIKAAMLELIGIYLDNLSIIENNEPSDDLQKIDMVLKYIDEHLGDNITVESLARQVYLHPNYFIVFFKGILGYSPIQYVNQRRMETAKGLLLKPDCNVSAVAGKVGMQIYYFSRMFKAHTGLSPSRYRKQAASFIASASDGEQENEEEHES
ncbi:AraC family transcriptional regulator [Cohnella terricola]|uniref:AraC family transcriptional regulator n=1 Tax=Cohnella terricola TaxID=1289167 RepID=A0A559JTM4_9BACL|nr:AraC family transcriptional regulator [Cohnella terricola]TVY03234.1 AraC family transcriptional regulator [Cohnella terricola]